MAPHARLLCLAVVLVSAIPATASTIEVDPVQIEISADRRSAALRVTNEEAVPITIRAFAVAWTQANGEDRYSDTSAVIISPPIFTIQGNGTQLVRIGFRSPAAAHGAYRLILEEVPQPLASGVRISLRLNLPLFASLEPGSASDLQWAAWGRSDGSWVIEAANSGSGYVRLEPEDLAAGPGIRHNQSMPLGVVLPKSRRRWIMRVRPDAIDSSRFQRIVRMERADDQQQTALTRD